jgi:hypothetical protein
MTGKARARSPNGFNTILLGLCVPDNSRPGVMLVALVLFAGLCAGANAQKVNSSSTSIEQQVLALNVTNGQHLSATVGQQIEITLGTVGASAIWRPAGVFQRRPAGEHRVRLATKPRWRNVCLHFPAGCRGEAQVTIPILTTETVFDTTASTSPSAFSKLRVSCSLDGPGLATTRSTSTLGRLRPCSVLLSQRRAARFARPGLPHPGERGQPVWVEIRRRWI